MDQKNKEKDFNNLFNQSVLTKTKSIPVIKYNLPYPKEKFLEFLVTEKNILLHGSLRTNLEILEPKQANDTAKLSGNQNAVYGVTDSVLPIFYAIQDRNKLRGAIISGFSKNPKTGEKTYDFKIPKDTLEIKPWKSGMIYLLDKGMFRQEKDDKGNLVDEWTSETPVKPIAKFEVGPEDFRFLNEVEGI